ncbi:hypothetical protein [Rhizobium herbae]|uniref:Uncharacterized protein n=1 Tax=Rhizobium herbae TaxID=508661 RepID=A0ABS4EPU7_9HYPH|nr:hypothetical protein [Rhizobium herbae]MBP1859979.1 hypothetical protein [Rhizobium herbae]
MNEILGGGTGFVLIGAGITLAGVVAGWLMSTASSRVGTRSKRSGASAAEVRQLALRTVIALDEFVGACQAAVNDTPEFNPSDPSEFVFHVEDPRLALPRDAEWSIMRTDVVEQLLWMPNRIRNVLDALDSLDIVPPAFDELFERREEDFSRLGLRALDLIQTISAEYELPIPERPAYYDPRREFQNRIQTIADARSRRREAGMGHKGDDVSNITPLFPKHRRDAALSALDVDPKA